MKRTSLFFCLLIAAEMQLLAQTQVQSKIPNRFYFSMGTHLNLWAHVGVRSLPVNFQAEMLVKENHALAIAYSFEEYDEAPYFLYYEPNLGDYRHNIRVRYAYYYRGSQKFYTQYIGFSAGVSYWNSNFPQNKATILPTSQFFYGMRFQLANHLFANLEFGLGSPYIIRAAVGTSF